MWLAGKRAESHGQTLNNEKFYEEARHGRNAEPNAKAPRKIRSTALTGSFFGKVASQGRRQTQRQVARAIYWSGL